jgi:hypothetical protein
LYAIDQDKKIKDQDKKIETLNNELEALKQLMKQVLDKK